MTLEGKRFNDGVIDLSSLRKKKEEEKAQQMVFDAEAVMNTIPPAFQATDGNGNEITLTVLSALVFPRGDIFIILTDNIPGEPPFLMVAKHENNIMLDGLAPATEEQFLEYQKILAEYEEEQADALLEEVEETEAVQEIIAEPTAQDQKGE